MPIEQDIYALLFRREYILLNFTSKIKTYIIHQLKAQVLSTYNYSCKKNQLTLENLRYLSWNRLQQSKVQFQNLAMQKRRSKSIRPSSKAKPKKKSQAPKKNYEFTVNITQALYRKYSSSQNHYYRGMFEKIVQPSKVTESTQLSTQQEHLQKYYHNVSRKHMFPRVKEIYKMHKQIPRIFEPSIARILNKCYHRKRLIQYFRIAKVLGLKVQSVKFSTFLLSISQHQNNPQSKFQFIVPKLSKYQFSDEIEKELLNDLTFHNNEKSSNLVSKQNIK